jgi:nitronate monooxygenase
MNWPTIIQGGMGAGVSSWRLAKAVSSLGQLGVVSGIALDVILVRRLQDGDPDGSVRRALDHFPVRSVASRVLDRYFVAGGKPEDAPYATVPMHSVRDSRALLELCMLGTFVEVFLAREGHDNPVGINFLEKIQLPHLPSMYGAMLAGVAFVLMGAGIALRVPGVLDRLAVHQPAAYEVSVTEQKGTGGFLLEFDPREFVGSELPPLVRPAFLPIISSNVLAQTMLKRANGRIDGFIVEGATAGGHNAPPRGKLQLDEKGQPVYGEKDQVDLAKIRDLGLPFWLAGGQGSKEKLDEALAIGAAGIQVGTPFAFCDESGLDPAIRDVVLAKARNGGTPVLTDPLASPTGFPFKVAELAGTLSEQSVYEARTRVCDLGFLRELYRKDDDSIGYRCAAEPVDAYVAKGGDAADTVGRKCLCNALIADIGQGQIRRDGSRELALVTAGDDLETLARFLADGRDSFTAADVIHQILHG